MIQREDKMKQIKYPFISLDLQKSRIKLFLSTVFLFIFIFSSCTINDLGTDPEIDQKIEGSGNLVSEDIEVPSFHSISMNTAGLVNITQNTIQNIEVTVDDNILDYLIIRVQDEVLIIEIVSDVTLSNFELTIDVSMINLESLVTNSAGSIRGLNAFEEDVVNLMVNSAGNIFMDLKVNQLNSMCNSAGNIFLSGQATDHNVMLSSAGNLNAFDLETENTTIVLNSAGNAYVFVSKTLDVTINSAGSVFFKGDPAIKRQINSIGRVYSAN